MAMICVDPGKKTGIAVFNNLAIEDRLGSRLDSSTTVTDPAAFLDWMQIELTDGDIVVYETFALRPGSPKSWEPEAVEMIGALKYVAGSANRRLKRTGGGISIFGQSPSSMKSSIPRTALRKLGGKWNPASEHEKDAIRHGLLWWLNVMDVEVLRFLESL